MLRSETVSREAVLTGEPVPSLSLGNMWCWCSALSADRLCEHGGNSLNTGKWSRKTKQQRTVLCNPTNLLLKKNKKKQQWIRVIVFGKGYVVTKRWQLIKVKLEGRLNLEFGVQKAQRARGLLIQACGFNPPSWDDVTRQQGWAHDPLTHELHLDS